MKWSKIEYLGLLIFVSLSIVLLLKPEVALPGGAVFSPYGTHVIQKMRFGNLSISAGELDFDTETNDVVLVDIRSRSEFDQFHIPDAYNVPFHELLSNRDTFCQIGQKVILYSLTGSEGWTAQGAILMQMSGCNTYWLKGGLISYLHTHSIPLEQALDSRTIAKIKDSGNTFVNTLSHNEKKRVFHKHSTHKKRKPKIRKSNVAEGC